MKIHNDTFAVGGFYDKEFDAVKMMREIRDQLSKEIINMTFEEEKAYLKNLLKQKKTLAPWEK